MIDLEIAQDRCVEALELIAQPLAPIIDLVGRRPVGEVIIAGAEETHAGGILAYAVNADGRDGNLFRSVVAGIVDQIEAHLALGSHRIGACRDDVFGADPVQPDTLDDMARKGVEFAHQGGQQAQRRVEPEFHRAIIWRAHAELVRRHITGMDRPRIRDGIEIAQNGKALGRIDNAPGRPGHIFSCQRMAIRPHQPLAQPKGPDEAALIDRPALRQSRPNRSVRRILGQAGMDLLVDQRRGCELTTGGI